MIKWTSIGDQYDHRFMGLCELMISGYGHEGVSKEVILKASKGDEEAWNKVVENAFFSNTGIKYRICVINNQIILYEPGEEPFASLKQKIN